MIRKLTLAFVLGTVCAVPCHQNCNSSLSAAPKQSCSKLGEYACLGNDTAVCNTDMTWAITKCPDGTKCMPNDWECIPLSEWDHWNKLLNSPKPAASTSTKLTAPSPPAPVPCTVHGQWTCFDSKTNKAGSGSRFKDLAQCNWGTLVVTKCGEGTACLENDWECVPEGDLQAWKERIKKPVKTGGLSATRTPSPSPSPPPPPPLVKCDTHGQWTCFDSKTNSAGVGKQFKDLAQCNWGTLVITKCTSGTACLQDDWECVPESEHAAWAERIAKTKGHQKCESH